MIITENGEPKNKKLHELICKKVDTVIRINQSKYEKEFTIDKFEGRLVGILTKIIT